MSRRRRQSLSPSLFPFLAVLVCTLGTLILLLALVAHNATVAAEQSARAEQQKSAKLEPAAPVAPRMSREAVESLLSEEEFRVTELVAVRDKQTAELESRRDELTHLDDHIARLRRQIRQLNEEVRQATGELESPEISDIQIAKLNEQIDAAKESVAKLREETADQAPRFVIVPHKGPNGTDRRPVYLECNAAGIVIWPEGAQIPIEQLENSSYSANPLDAALRTIRLHAMQNYGDPVPPYPLLVVRPDGIDSYGAARRAMRDWDDQFGYELVPSDIKLAFPKPDDNLRRRIEAAIQTAAAEQRVRLAMSQRVGGGRGSFGPAPDGRGGSGRSSLPTLSAAALDRAGRASGFGQLRDEYRGSSVSSSAVVPPNKLVGPQIDSNPNSGYARSTSEINDAGAAARRMAEQMQSAAREMRTERLAPGESETLNPFVSDRSEMEPAAGTPNGSDNDDPPSLSASNANTDGGRQTGTDNGGANSAAVSSSASNNPPAVSRPDTSMTGTSTAGPPSAMQNYQSMQNNPSMQNAAAMQGSAVSQGTPIMQETPADREERWADIQPPPQLSQLNPPPRMPPANLVRREGRDWAMPSSMAGMRGNAIVRTMRLQCYPDRFVLLPSKNDGSTEVFGFFSGDIERATLELATALRSRIDRWGPALPGGRWQPRLEVQTAPGSAMQFDLLRSLMSGSGIELVGKESSR